ncbi:MAG: YfhO family protein [Prevotellaceae bacterium]|nr:YfhO family protein [Prevotellaceae bacterium]
MQLFKKIWPDVAAIIFFVAIGFIYFLTPVSEGMVLSGSDHTGAIGSNHELSLYHERTGEETRWTNSLFSGMPTYQMAPSYDSRTTLSALRSIYELGLPTVVMYVFILLLGFYILMRSFGFKPLLSVLGAIAWAFSSYYFIIIGAGHIWKLLTLAFIPPTIAGMVMCYKGRYLWGGCVLALFLSFQILSNHLQMTYYFLLVMFAMAVAWFIDAYRKKQLSHFFKATAIIAVAALIAVCTNISNLYHTYQYSKETMRGRSDLAVEGSSHKSGLSPEYITQWSYGIDETWTLLIPNAKGGASVPLSNSEIAMEKGEYTQYYNVMGMYWGDQPGTSGPVYVGAFIIFLFVLSWFVVKGPMKWALLVVTLISILLSWGHNFMGFTQFCIDHVPLYNKFRTVSSILVIAEFTIPLLAIMALAKILKEKSEALGHKMWKFYGALALTAGIALLFALVPSIFPSYTSLREQEQLAQYPELLADLTMVRKAIFAADAWRSFFFIIIGAAFVWLFAKNKLKAIPTLVAISLLCLIDMYAVNKRYLNDDMFVMPDQIHNSFVKTSADEQILADPDPNYRVLNFTTNTFNENETSYFHKSIGGYSAVKLGRYQDIIDNYISPTPGRGRPSEMQQVVKAYNTSQGDLTTIKGDSLFPVLNMLNCKYFILSAEGKETFAVHNPFAMGNAWFVDQVKFVDNARAEIDALNDEDLHRVAVVDNSFKSTFGNNATNIAHDSTSTIRLTHYEPNSLDYQSNSPTGGVAVFSEVYYPGWTATLDGKPLELGRANYILRTAYIPAGKHNIHMEYKPASIQTTETLAYISIALLIAGLLAAIGISIKKEKQKKQTSNE